jgi:hypothetical protein
VTIHIQVDAWLVEETGEHSNGRIACGLETLPEGDKVVYEGDSYAYHMADCQTCNPGGPKPHGTPISELSGRPGHAGFGAFRQIAESWGHE